ncbi:MAG: hypothetical protein G01um101491_268 [Parcubacteria group bacterium Gr01-1014_91]|nr:MAG: hypothetical protein G01um101491_268 [Parcubacteria group bacterium Gr01-1014_91]
MGAMRFPVSIKTGFTAIQAGERFRVKHFAGNTETDHASVQADDIVRILVDDVQVVRNKQDGHIPLIL